MKLINVFNVNPGNQGSPVIFYLDILLGIHACFFVQRNDHDEDYFMQNIFIPIGQLFSDTTVNFPKTECGFTRKFLQFQESRVKARINIVLKMKTVNRTTES
jgi:hypothetical protein